MEGGKGWREREPQWPKRKELRALGGMREHWEGRGPGESFQSWDSLQRSVGPGIFEHIARDPRGELPMLGGPLGDSM